jgi:hypothetical protein
MYEKGVWDPTPPKLRPDPLAEVKYLTPPDPYEQINVKNLTSLNLVLRTTSMTAGKTANIKISG